MNPYEAQIKALKEDLKESKRYKAAIDPIRNGEGAELFNNWVNLCEPDAPKFQNANEVVAFVANLLVHAGMKRCQVFINQAGNDIEQIEREIAIKEQEYEQLKKEGIEDV